MYCNYKNTDVFRIIMYKFRILGSGGFLDLDEKMWLEITEWGHWG